MKSEVAATGHRLWSDRVGGTEVRFVGRGIGGRTTAAAAAGAPPDLAWCRQIHSAKVISAAAGACGEGDALTTRRTGLALSVVTADCVPILLAGDVEIASIHAGWRGIAAGIVAATLDRVETPAARLTAWLGPAVGPCCYEVGEDVASRVAASSDPGVVVPQQGSKLHLDLHLAAEIQLRQAGVQEIHRVSDCTHCSPGTLCSYRRDGPGAGRNLAFIWIDDH